MALSYLSFFDLIIELVRQMADYQEEPWRESLFDVCASPKIFLKGLCCPACMFGDNVSQISGGSYCGYCCIYLLLLPGYLCGLVHMSVRTKIREKYGLKEEPSDFIAACVCSPCAVCQEAREILSRENTPTTIVQTKQPMSDMLTTAESEIASSSNASHTS